MKKTIYNLVIAAMGAALLLPSSAGAASVNADIFNCSKITNQEVRLECFDELAETSNSSIGVPVPLQTPDTPSGDPISVTPKTYVSTKTSAKVMPAPAVAAESSAGMEATTAPEARAEVPVIAKSDSKDEVVVVMPVCPVPTPASSSRNGIPSEKTVMIEDMDFLPAVKGQDDNEYEFLYGQDRSPEGNVRYVITAEDAGASRVTVPRSPAEPPRKHVEINWNPAPKTKTYIVTKAPEDTGMPAGGKDVIYVRESEIRAAPPPSFETAKVTPVSMSASESVYASMDTEADDIDDIEVANALVTNRRDLTGNRMAFTSDQEPLIPRPERVSAASVSDEVISPPSYEGWLMFEEVNPLDDTKTISLLREAEGSSEQWGDVPYLVVRCKSKQTELYIIWHDYLGSNTRIVTRVGNHRAQTVNWGVSTDGTASFYPHSPISFIKDLNSSDRFVAQATPFNKTPVTAVFDLQGLNKAIKPLQKNCHWR